MQIAKKSKIRSKIRDLYDRVEATEIVEELLTDPIEVKGIYFDGYFQMNEEARKLQWEMKQDGHEIDFDKALIATMLFSVTDGEDDDFTGVILDNVIDGSKVFHKGDLDDPYLNTIKVNGETATPYTLDTNYYAKYELFTYGEEFEVIDGVYAPKVAVSDRKLRYPAVKSGEDTFFALTPRYMASVKDAAENAKGKVLCLGSNLGYFAYLAALKEDVESVTVIEPDAALAELLSQSILPQFEQKDKVKILMEEPLSFMETLEDGTFDYCFSDISSSRFDFLPYLNMRKACEKFSSMEVEYRIEEAIIRSISFLTLTLLMFEQREHEVSVAEPFYRELKFLQYLLEEQEIDKAEDVDWVLDPKNLLGLMK